MTREEIKYLVKDLSKEEEVELIETHISWILLTNKFAYKFKKPIRFSFLNYSNSTRRMFYCEREVELNSRYSNIYLEVIPVYKSGDEISLNQGTDVIDYGVKMLRMDQSLQMDKMIKNDLVTTDHVKTLANKIARFHQKAETIRTPFSSREMVFKFEDLRTVRNFLHNELGIQAVEKINDAILESNHFINSNVPLFESRIKYGFVRDLHGDLHAKNIFLYKEPILFDCIEFNDDYRRIDVLNEIAFLYMDLEARGKEELASIFLSTYLDAFPIMGSYKEEQLFDYYKCYRANVRAKVNAISAKQASDEADKIEFLKQVELYLDLMDYYKNRFSGNSSSETYELIYEHNHFL